ncbi:MAG TPA: NAD-glutamate dehydrogenase [Caulobacteraceae bacterium]|nr:NAD-glutamate dehydrogenase [Caulobacteraceae bacterium]
MDASPAPSSLIEAFAAALGKTRLSPDEYAFASQVLEDARAEDLADELTPEDFAAILAGFWSFAETRAGPAPKVRLRRAEGAGGRPLALDVLEIVQTDAPFLVDSVLAEVAARRLELKGMAHPVVSVARDAEGRRRSGGAASRESLILLLLTPVGEDRREAILKEVEETLADVHAAVDDFGAMTALMRRTIEELGTSAAPTQPYGLDEQLAFLNWLTADRFVFLGARVYDYPRDAAGDYLRDEPSFDRSAGLGVLRDPQRSVMRRASEPALLTPDPKAYLSTAPAVMVSKANLHTRVHRRTHMDFIGVRRYGPDGMPTGEVRFVGLFTADAYELPPREIPIVRRKIERVLHSGRSPSEHDRRRLRHIVETYPRDDLFQIDEDTLLGIADGVLHLYDRPRVRVFVWRDAFDRFLSILLYAPRERYQAETARKAAAILAEAWGGEVSVVYPRIADEPLVRIHVIVRLLPGEHPEPDLRALEAEITESMLSWTDRFEAEIRAAEPVDVGATLSRWGEAFPTGYRDRYDATEAYKDLRVIEDLASGAGDPVRVRSYRSAGDPATRFRFKLYVRPGPAPLSDVLPIVEHMGLKGLDEAGFPVTPAGTAPEEAIWVHDFLLEDSAGETIEFDEVAAVFEAALTAVWTGRAESDGFNRLVLELGVPWREAALVRAFARWRQQAGLDPSQAVQEAALSAHPGVTRLILDLFRIKFDPAIQASLADRGARADAVYAEIEAALQLVVSLDEDRVLRRLAQTVRAMTRTNYFQLDATGEPKAYISFKVASREVEALPAPKPFREVFVASRRVEGVHLRFGPVARGGLRWSDRRDDFRTEVLGLVKAQQVKNAVIVPVGSKGGFYPKRLPREGADAVRAEAVEAYKVFLSGVLDLTDNLDGGGGIVRPEGVIAHDADDPYLVVAADKGTATFSDIANGVAESYGFWLGDAFASGGSHGYDHKAMGITARGAWESAKRHFREMGKDIQTEGFTVIGVGDMSGDVFGNGMLLSKATRLVAAFDHRHVFLDPDPDPEKSWAERSRLFALPRSSWDDYDKTLISPGGGVFPRTAKQIDLTPEVKALLGIQEDALAPAELIRAVMTAKAEMLYFGGIGTYVKAAGESHADVGDKANDAVRVDAGELRCQVVIEGANLGVTQAGRVAFARGSGRINTDAIDNSAGVDTSDHEVNIKILAGQAIAGGRLKREDRDPLLMSMTDEVAAHVLAHNYAQTLALSLAEAEAPAELDSHARFMAELVAAGKLDRRVEGLPGPAALAELKAKGAGLTRPELAVLMAYGKLELSDLIVNGPGPDDEGYFEDYLKAYFPTALAAYEPEMRKHRLRREIIATGLANAIVDRCGPTFPSRLMAAVPCDAATAAAAFDAARRVFGLDETWAQVATLDLKIPAAAQRMLFQDVAAQWRAQTFWLATRAMAASGKPPTVDELIRTYRPAIEALRGAGSTLLSAYDQASVAARTAAFVEAGAPVDLAEAVAGLAALRTAVEIACLAGGDWAPQVVGRLFHTVGATFGFDRLRGAAVGLALTDEFERRAVRRLIIDLVDEQTALTRAVMGVSKPSDPAEAGIVVWSESRRAAIERAARTVGEIEAAGDGWSFAKLTLAHSALREVALG